jgi:uncharacterized protein
MYKRWVEQNVLEALEDTPVILLHGARQSGKSTLAQQLGRERNALYRTLDDATQRAAAENDPYTFLETGAKMLIVDEVQRVPELFLAIKTLVDRDRRPGRFLLTGSANVFLLPRLSESLAGRLEVVTLHPLAQGEIEGNTPDLIDFMFGDALEKRLIKQPRFESTNLLERIVAGGFPESVARSSRRREAWFDGYITALLTRDVRDISQIEDLSALPRLLTLLSSRVMGLLNLADLSRTLDIPQTTLKRYFALLEAVFMIQLLPAWSRSTARRLIKAPKLMLMDTGLTASRMGWTADYLESHRSSIGFILEQFVALELLRMAGNSAARPGVFHYRTASNLEVDVVLESRLGRVVGLEVKASQSVTSSDFGGLRALREDAGEAFHAGFVVYSGSEFVRFEENLWAFPIAALWTPLK